MYSLYVSIYFLYRNVLLLYQNSSYMEEWFSNYCGATTSLYCAALAYV